MKRDIRIGDTIRTITSDARAVQAAGRTSQRLPHTV